MEQLAQILVAALVLVGGAFTLIGSWGLVRLPSLMTRLHGPTKATTLGVGSMLLASMIHFPAAGQGLSFHELLIALFLFITAPISANMIAKAHLHRQGRGIDPDQAEPDARGLPMVHVWATFHGAGAEAGMEHGGTGDGRDDSWGDSWGDGPAIAPRPSGHPTPVPQPPGHQ